MSTENENIITKFRHSEILFIGKYVHGSINLPTTNNVFSWKDIWENILLVYYECVHLERNHKKFYWILTMCMAKVFISQKINFLELPSKSYMRIKEHFDEKQQKGFNGLSEVENTTIMDLEQIIQLQYDKLIKHFLYLSYKAICKNNDNIQYINNIMDESFKNIELIYKKNLHLLLRLENEERSIEEINELREDINKRVKSDFNDIIEDLFSTIYTRTTSSSPSSVTITKDILRCKTTLLPQELIQYWVHFGPLYWLWFHLTAASFSNLNNNDDNNDIKNNVHSSDNELSSMLKELFNHIDIFISCSECQQHFVIMRETNEYVNIKELQPCDIFIIRIHEIVRNNHSRKGIPVNFLNKKIWEIVKNSTDDVADNNIKNNNNNDDDDISNNKKEKYLLHLRNEYKKFWSDSR